MRQIKTDIRVLLLTGMYPSPANPLNGSVVKAQMVSLEKLGVQVDLCHLRANGRATLTNNGRKLLQMRAARDYDLLHLHYGLSATILGFLPHLPVVATYHGTDINGYPSYGWARFPQIFAWNAASLITRQLSRYLNGIIVMTERMRAQLPKGSRKKTWVVPMGIDLDVFRQVPYEAARRALGWGTDKVVLFSDTNRERVKRPDMARAAVSVAQEKTPDLRMQVLQGIAHEKIPFMLSAADCLLVTSDREGSPNIVKEALACNLPIVSVDVGDVKDVLKNNRAAGRIEPRDPACLAEALVDVVSRPRPDNLKGMVQPYGLYETAVQIRDIYETVLAGI